MFWDSDYMLTRVLLYTAAITRATARVALLSEAGAIGQALRTDEQVRRRTMLIDGMATMRPP